jgi:hypothetical protein
MVSMPEEQLDGLVLHELMHALQDQYHDLAAKTRAVLATGNDDATSAWQSLVEGEATLVMTIRALRAHGLEGVLDVAVTQARDASRATLLGQVEAAQDRAKGGSGDVERAVSALRTMPDYLFWSLHAPYFRGQYAVFRVEKEGGWGAVDALFDRPPTSTNQIFHPEKIAAGARDGPQAITLAANEIAGALGPSWRVLHSNVLGELGVFTLMDEKLPPEPPNPIASMHGESSSRRARVAAGWAGDRYAGFEDAQTGAVAVVWKTLWDTEVDAAEFRAGLADIGMRDDMVSRGKEVLLLHGVPAAARERVIAAIER